jgi:hypothetical protein
MLLIQKMKRLTFLLLLCLQQANATTFYVKATGGNGSGLSDDTAWSYAKLNGANLTPGDVVLFKRGDVFYGELTVRNGNSGSPVSYGAYGEGANPAVSGLSTLTQWSQFSDHIYYTTLDVPELNVVSFDGKLQGMGRYPKTGYLTYTGHSKTNSISGSSIGTIPFNPVGAEVVIRKIRQITDRHIP